MLVILIDCLFIGIYHFQSFLYSQKEDFDADKAPKGEVNISQIDYDDLDSTVYLAGSSNKEMRIHIKGDKSEDKKSKVSRDRLLMLQALDREGAEAWVQLLKEWVTFINY